MERFVCVFIVFLFQYQLNAEVSQLIFLISIQQLLEYRFLSQSFLKEKGGKNRL